jgi:hypothetical protein
VDPQCKKTILEKTGRALARDASTTNETGVAELKNRSKQENNLQRAAGSGF